MKDLIADIQKCHRDNARCYARLCLEDLPACFQEHIREVHLHETWRASLVLMALVAVEVTGAGHGLAQEALTKYANAATEAVDAYNRATKFLQALDTLAHGPAAGEA